MKLVNPYFEASDSAEFEIRDERFCWVSKGTVRAVEDGAIVYSRLGSTAIAGAHGTSAVATDRGALAIATASGANAIASAPGAFAQCWAEGALAQAAAPFSTAHAPFGRAIGQAPDAFVFTNEEQSSWYRCSNIEGVTVDNLEAYNTGLHEEAPRIPTQPSRIGDASEAFFDLGFIMAHKYYAEDFAGEGAQIGYPWELDYTGLDEPGQGFSVAMNGKQILANPYTPAGMHLRDAIRHAEILGDHVPDLAYTKLKGMTVAAVLAKPQVNGQPGGIRKMRKEPLHAIRGTTMRHDLTKHYPHVRSAALTPALTMPVFDLPKKLALTEAVAVNFRDASGKTIGGGLFGVTPEGEVVEISLVDSEHDVNTDDDPAHIALGLVMTVGKLMVRGDSGTNELPWSIVDFGVSTMEDPVLRPTAGRLAVHAAYRARLVEQVVQYDAPSPGM